MARQFPLQALFQAIHRSVVKATRVAQDASLRSLQRDYFEEVVDGEGNPTGEIAPKIIRMVLPHHEGSEIKQAIYEVPLFSLVKHQAMSIAELDMEFEVELHGLDQLQEPDGEDGDILSASTSGGMWAGRKTIAKVQMKFRGEDAPEGVMRLNDKILKVFPD